MACLNIQIGGPSDVCMEPREPLRDLASNNGTRMSENCENQLSQEEKLARWRRERPSKQAMTTYNNPSSKENNRRPRPSLQPLPAKRTLERRAVRTPQSTAAHNQKSSRTTPYSTQSSSASKSSLPRSGGAKSSSDRKSFLSKPTVASSLRKSVRLAKHPSHITDLNRSSHGLLSTPRSTGVLSRTDSKETTLSSGKSSASKSLLLYSGEKATVDRPSSFLKPTTTSSRKSMGISSRRPLAKLPDLQPSTRVAASSRRQTLGGRLSQPPVRLSQVHTPSSTTSSFRALSDTQHYSASSNLNDGDFHASPGASLRSITLASPRLPMTSPLPIFSPLPDGHHNYMHTPLGANIDLGGDSASQDDEHEIVGVHINTLPANELEAETNKEELIELDKEKPTGNENAYPSDADDTTSQQPDTIPQQADKESPFVVKSERTLEEELPTLNAALDDFTNLNLSFNMDFSDSDEEGGTAFHPPRVSRERTRKLGLLLPIPSLREELLEGKKASPMASALATSHLPFRSKTNKRVSLLPASDQSPIDRDTVPNLQDTPQEAVKSRSLVLESPDDLLSPLGILPQDPPMEISILSPIVDEPTPRRRGRLIMLLPIPSLREDDTFSPIAETNEHSEEEEMEDSPADAPPADLEPSKEATESPESDRLDLPKSKHAIQTSPDNSTYLDALPLVKYKERHILATVPEEIPDTAAIEALQDQLARLLQENRQYAERWKRYNRSYEDRVTPYRTLFEEWRQQQRRWKATETSHQAMVAEVQTKFSTALQLSLQKCHTLQAQLEASQDRVAELEGARPNGAT